MVVVLRMNKMMKTFRSILTIVLTGILMVGIALFIWAVSWCGTATFQEGNPLPFIRAMQQMNRTDKEIAVVEYEQPAWLMKNQLAEQDALTQFLRQQGWHAVDRMGTARTYQRGEESLRITCRMFTRHYQFCIAY
jgi:hypothetical protein